LKIQGNILLPLNTLLKIDLRLRNLQETVTFTGKIKWNKIIIENEIYEAGVEFIDVPDDIAKKSRTILYGNKSIRNSTPSDCHSGFMQNSTNQIPEKT